MTKFWLPIALGIGFFVMVTGGSYVSTKAGSNGSAVRQVASPALAQIELTRAEEAGGLTSIGPRPFRGGSRPPTEAGKLPKKTKSPGRGWESPPGRVPTHCTFQGIQGTCKARSSVCAV